MSRYLVESDELYPWFYANPIRPYDEADPRPWRHVIDLTDDEAADLARVEREWEAWQERLRDAPRQTAQPQ